jgi:hypothetical protein
MLRRVNEVKPDLPEGGASAVFGSSGTVVTGATAGVGAETARGGGAVPCVEPAGSGHSARTHAK